MEDYEDIYNRFEDIREDLAENEKAETDRSTTNE